MAEVDKISDVIKSVKKVSNETLIAGISVYWLAFNKALPGGRTTLLAFLLWAANQGGQSALDKMIPPTEFKLTNLGLKSKVAERVDFIYKALDKTGIEWAAGVIEEGLKQNMSSVDIAKFLREEADEIVSYRADLITETELITAMNVLEMETYKRNGLEKHRWVTSEDERVCPICNANDGHVVKIGEEFPSGTVSPVAHIGCRCYLLPILPHAFDKPIWRGR